MSPTLLGITATYSDCVKVICHQFFLKYNKYVGVHSWKAAHLPTLDIRVKQNKGKKLQRPGIEPGTLQYGWFSAAGKSGYFDFVQ